MANFRDVEPFLQNGGKIDPLSEIRNAGIVTNGSVFWVKDPSDNDYTTFKDQVGAANTADTIQDGVNKTRNDKNDYVFVAPKDSNGVWAPNGTAGTALVLNKARMHLISSGYQEGHFGYTNTIRAFATTAAYDTSIVKVFAPGVEFAGFRILGTNGTSDNGTVTGGLLALGTASTGTAHGFNMHDSSVENTQAAAAGGTIDIVTISGDVGSGIIGPRFDNVWIGAASWAPAALVRMSGTAGPTRTVFDSCTFVIDAQATTDSFITIGTGAMEYTIFKNSDFINVEAGTLPASALVGAVLVDNPVLLRNNSYVNVTQAGTDTEVFKSPAASGTAASVRDYGIAIGTAALTPV